MEKIQEINWNNINNSIIEKSIWGSIIQKDNNKYLFMRFDSFKDCTYNNGLNADSEAIYRFNINYEGDKINLEHDKDFKLDMYAANHNLCFQKVNNKIYLIGGLSVKLNYHIFKEYFENYFKNEIKYFKSEPDNLKSCMNNWKLIEHDHFCPFFANGYYIFKILDIHSCKRDEIFPLNPNRPSIDRWLSGNHDAFYSDNSLIKNLTKKSKTILDLETSVSKCIRKGNIRGGLSCYDSQGSILYNPKDKKYYLYQRANIAKGLRNIQYTTSYDLINWSSWNLIKYVGCDNKVYAKGNYYCSNFFNIEGLNGYFGILAFNGIKISRKKKCPVPKPGEYHFAYSLDCINWCIYENFIPNLPVIWENTFPICGELIEKDGKQLFFSNFTKAEDLSNPGELSICSIDKNRFIYADCEDVTKPGKIVTKLLNIEDTDKIFFNFTTYENGYIEVRLLDKDKRMVKPYTSSRFYKIGSNCNDSKYQLKWNKKRWDKSNVNYKEINFKEFHIEITGMNFKLYSIAW